MLTSLSIHMHTTYIFGILPFCQLVLLAGLLNATITLMLVAARFYRAANTLLVIQQIVQYQRRAYQVLVLQYNIEMTLALLAGVLGSFVYWYSSGSVWQHQVVHRVYEQFTLGNLSISRLNRSAATITSLAVEKHGYLGGNIIRVCFLFVVACSDHLCGYDEVMKWYGGQSVLHYMSSKNVLFIIKHLSEFQVLELRQFQKLRNDRSHEQQQQQNINAKYHTNHNTLYTYSDYLIERKACFFFVLSTQSASTL